MRHTLFTTFHHSSTPPPPPASNSNENAPKCPQQSSGYTVMGRQSALVDEKAASFARSQYPVCVCVCVCVRVWCVCASLSLTLTHSHSLSLTPSLTLTHSFTHTRKHPPTQTPTHSHTHSLSLLSLSLSLSLFVAPQTSLTFCLSETLSLRAKANTGMSCCAQLQRCLACECTAFEPAVQQPACAL